MGITVPKTTTEQHSIDQYAVVGNPISQSKSPLIHRLFARSTHQSMEYTALLSPIGQFIETIDAFVLSGAKGLNVTAPFKMDAFAYATEKSERAMMAGAANCLKFEGGKIFADNFDGVGLVRDITHNLKFSLTGKKIALLGAGGATRGSLIPLLQQKPASLVIFNRDTDKANHLISELRANNFDTIGVTVSSYQNMTKQTFDCIINATSASLMGGLPPISNSLFDRCSLAYDLVYGKGLTPFLTLAKSSNCRHMADGVGMLVEQAAEAFAWWRGVRPDTQQVIQAMTVPLV
jgi:shikimate dehydrogenase